MGRAARQRQAQRVLRQDPSAWRTAQSALEIADRMAAQLEDVAARLARGEPLVDLPADIVAGVQQVRRTLHEQLLALDAIRARADGF